jgi:HEAT repeat protein
MKTTNRVNFRTFALVLITAFMAFSWAASPAMAETREIPNYVQLHLNNTIKNAVADGDIVRMDKMDLNSIMALLDHRNHRVASAAAYALGEIRDPEAVPALVSALKSDCDHMRRIAAHALGKIGDRRAVMPLIEVLCSEPQPTAVQASAIMSLGKLGDPRAKRILTHLNHSQRNWLQHTASIALSKINANNDFTVAVIE